MFIKETDSTGMKIAKGTALFFGGAALLAAGGAILGYTAQKGANVANRVPMPGEASNDDSMTTAQAGARGARQRAA